MMGEEISSDGVERTRSVLGDVTNQLGKRGFSSISTLGVKSGVDDKNSKEGLQVAKKECIRAEILKKEKFTASVSPDPCVETNSLKGNVISGTSKIQCESKEQDSSDGTRPIIGFASNFDDTVRDSCVFISSAPTIVLDVDGSDVGREISQDESLNTEVVHEKVETSISINDCNEVSLDNLDPGKDEFAMCSQFPESQESRSCAFDRCIGRKEGDGFSNSITGIDLIKACSCSFCTKAAYIWSDLHYQDVKGRIAALKKSQKESSILVHRSCGGSGSGRHGQGGFDRLSKLESDLKGQWRSLFVHMEDMFARECSQLRRIKCSSKENSLPKYSKTGTNLRGTSALHLVDEHEEASLFTLQDLRDSCKTDLEPTDGLSSEKQ